MDYTKFVQAKSLVLSAENDCTITDRHKFHISSCWGMVENCWMLGHGKDAELWLGLVMRLLAGNYPPPRRIH